jgi:D-3-phosphoglycerate dehydrogenase
VWKKQQTGVTCNELFDKTVGLVGIGAIGRQVASYLKAFGAKVLYTDVFRATQETEQQLSLSYVPSFQELLPHVDILSFHCPLTSENKEMLNADTIKLMKDGAMVVNTARGKLIDPKALYEALNNGKLRTAALDVHYEEPIPKEYALAKFDNVILTPHIAGLTYEAFYAMMSGAVENIVTFEKGNIDKIKNKRLL